MDRTKEKTVQGSLHSRFSNSIQPLTGRTHEPGLARRPLWSISRSMQIANVIINLYNQDDDSDNFGDKCKMANCKATWTEQKEESEATLQHVTRLQEGDGCAALPAGEKPKKKPGRRKTQLIGPCVNTCTTTAMKHGVVPYWHRPPQGAIDFSPTDVLCSKCYAAACKSLAKDRKRLRLSAEMPPD